MSVTSRNVRVDTLRRHCTGIPEVILAEAKPSTALVEAARRLLNAEQRVLVTRARREHFDVLRRTFGSQLRVADEHCGLAILSCTARWRAQRFGRSAVLADGSSDYHAAEEAALSAEFLGLKVHRFYDCGVAGLHRTKAAVAMLDKQDVDVVIVVAGMEGTLPSIIAGLVRQPVIAVPTSVGYGTGYGGAAALLTMLNSCSPGIVVVNIDNGFGAAAAAAKFVRRLWKRK